MGCALPLLALELAFRALGIAPPQPGLDAEGAPVVNWAARERNRQGFHDREWVLRKSDDRARVLVLGDSFVHGRDVPLARLLHTRVEALVDERLGRDACELWNLGRRGASTHNEVELLEQRGLRYEPDAVLIVFFVNDATALDTNASLVAEMNDALHERDGWLNQASAAWDYFHWRLTRRSVGAATIEQYRAAYLGDKQTIALWRTAQRALQRARALADENGFHLGLAIFPALLQLDEEHALQDVYEEVERTCAMFEIPTLNLLPSFLGHDPRELWVSPTDAHPNGRAYELAAEPLADFLLEQGFVARER